MVKSKAEGTLPELPCACANLRRAARAVTRLYDRELSVTGLELSQFTLLMTLDQTGAITQKTLAGILAMDSTTLTRTLRTVVQSGWVKANPGEDRREKILSLSAAGRKKFLQSKPHWERAQSKLQERVGDDAWRAMGILLGKLAGAAIID